jgi:hypothetical protein
MSTIAVLAFFAASGLPHQAPPTDPCPELVRQLGEKSYRVRTAAAAELARMGSAAVPALRDGARHLDPEIAAQCRRLLPQAEARQRKENLDALVNDTTPPPAKLGGAERGPQPRPSGPESTANQLAGLEPFLKVTGDNRSARELYAELMREHGRAMELREQDPREAIRAFNEVGEQSEAQVREAYKKGAKTKYEAMNPTPAEIALFLVFSADPRVSDGPRHRAFNNVLALSPPKLKAALTEGRFAAPMRKLFINWLVNDRSTYFRLLGFAVAAEVKLPDFAPAMVRLIEGTDSSAEIKAGAMVSLLKSGSAGEVKVLSRYLTDPTVVCVHVTDNGQRIKTQLRDVAMGVSLQLAGQHPRDYGLTDDRFGPGVFGIPRHLYYYGFLDDKARDAAHKKWKEWVDKNPSVLTPR